MEPRKKAEFHRCTRCFAIASLLVLCCIFETGHPASLSSRTSAAIPVQKSAPDHAKSDGPTQPIPYSHKKHLAFGLPCRECHPNPDPGDRMTIPVASKCMACHSTIAKDKPTIQKLSALAKSGDAIPWVRVYVLPAWVYWNHRAHLEAAMTCGMCHGDVADMEVMFKATNVTTMAGCIDCHREKHASTGCKYCHADK